MFVDLTNINMILHGSTETQLTVPLHWLDMSNGVSGPMKFPLDSHCDTIDLTFHVKGAGEWMVISILIQIYYKILILPCMIPGGDDVSISNQHGDVTHFLVGTTHSGVGSKGSGGRQAEAHVVNTSPSGGRGEGGSLMGGKRPCCF